MIIMVAFGAGCDPADSLTNQDYRPYLENYEKWEATDVVTTFNTLESGREQFKCGEQLRKAHRARWREEAGAVKVDQTPEGKALLECLSSFQESSGIGSGKLKSAVLLHWMNHNFLPDAEKALDAEVAADQGRLDSAGCGGEQCQALTVVGDLAVQRVGQEVSMAWQDARSACSRAGFGGLSPWRLPTREELVAMRESGKLVTDLDTATYWSSSREFDDQGTILAYVLRFDLASLSFAEQPKAIPFDRDGYPSLAKIRCVSDLGKAPEPTGPVAEMEKRVVELGCPLNWEYKARIRDNFLVTWEKVVKSGDNARTVCKGLGWCGLTWRATDSRTAKQLSSDPWIGSDLNTRCVTDLPEKRP